MQKQGFVKYKIENTVATVVFHHPAGNALPSYLLDELKKTFEKISGQNTVKLIVLRSEGGRTFCAGAFLDTLLEIEHLDDSIAFFSGFAAVINAMKNCPQPIIGVAYGKAVGGGVGLLAACDMVFATENAALRLSELQIGIGAFVIAPVVIRKIGQTAYENMVWQPDKWHDVRWAKSVEFYTKVFVTVNDLENNVQNTIEKFSNYDTSAIYLNKKICWEGTEHWEKLLFERAKITGTLAMSEAVQKRLKLLKK